VGKDMDGPSAVRRALKHLAAARALQAAQLYVDVYFHCQQALELVIKAVYAERTKQRWPRIHNLVELSDMAEVELAPDMRRLFADLSELYVRTRYDMDVLSELEDEGRARRTLSETEEAAEWLMGLLACKSE